MTGKFSARTFFVCALSAIATACHKKAVVPAPPAPTIVLPQPAPPKEAPLPAAPKVETKAPPDSPPIPEKKVDAPPPRKRPAPPRKKTAPKKSVPEPKPDPTPAEQPTQPAAPAPPRFGEILSPEKTKEFTKRLDAATERVRQALGMIQAKTLTEEQREAMSRIRVFLTQAEQAREQDLQNAVSLAERADLLSRDLLDRLR